MGTAQCSRLVASRRRGFHRNGSRDGHTDKNTGFNRDIHKNTWYLGHTDKNIGRNGDTHKNIRRNGHTNQDPGGHGHQNGCSHFHTGTYTNNHRHQRIDHDGNGRFPPPDRPQLSNG
jgi:hypothetical protein